MQSLPICVPGNDGTDSSNINTDAFAISSNRIFVVGHRRTLGCGRAEVEIWASGSVRRELLQGDDCADALVHIFDVYSQTEPINVGGGKLARMVARIVSFEKHATTDLSKPDGPARRLMNSDKLRSIGWEPSIGLEDGLRSTYAWLRGRCDAIGLDAGSTRSASQPKRDGLRNRH